MGKYLRISSYIRKEALPHMILQLLYSEFPYFYEEIINFFYQCSVLYTLYTKFSEDEKHIQYKVLLLKIAVYYSSNHTPILLLENGPKWRKLSWGVCKSI